MMRCRSLIANKFRFSAGIQATDGEDSIMQIGKMVAAYKNWR
jgi:hypothetical protein